MTNAISTSIREPFPILRIAFVVLMEAATDLRL
jgi:hypothetical protein